MKRFLKILVSVGMLVLIVRMVGDPRSLALEIAGLSPIAIIASLLLNTLDRVLMAYKWIRLLAYRGYRLVLMRAVKIYCSSTIWGMFLPATMGADAVRAACTVREGISAREVIASIVIERMIGLLATPLLAIGGLLLLRATADLDPRLEPIWWLSLATLFGGTLVFLVSLSARFHEFVHYKLLGSLQQLRLFALLAKVHKTFRDYGAAKSELAIFFVLTLVENALPIVITWVIGRGLGAPVDLIHVAAAVPLAYLVARIPFSIGGIGVYEGVFVLVLAAADIPLKTSLAIALLARVLQILAWLPWWFAYMAEGGRRPNTNMGSSSLARLSPDERPPDTTE